MSFYVRLALPFVVLTVVYSDVATVPSVVSMSSAGHGDRSLNAVLPVSFERTKMDTSEDGLGGEIVRDA